MVKKKPSIKTQELLKTKQFWKETLRHFVPTREQRKTGSWYYKELWEKAKKNKNGLRFLSGFSPVIIKSRHWFVLSFGAYTGEIAMLKLVAGTSGNKLGSRKNQNVLIASISFEPKTVVIESVQGVRGTAGLLTDLKTHVNMHGADFVVSEIERQAKKLGYGKVTLPDPKHLNFYKNPYLETYDKEGRIVKMKRLDESVPYEKVQIDKIRRRIEMLYYGIINNRGFVRDGAQFVKVL